MRLNFSYPSIADIDEGMRRLGGVVTDETRARTKPGGHSWLRVAVVRGGRSLEREISLRSGHHVAAALRHLGHDVIEVDVDDELDEVPSSAPTWSSSRCTDATARTGRSSSRVRRWASRTPDLGPLTCRFCFDKGLAKGILNQAGLPTPPGYVLSAEAVRHMGAGAALRRAAERLGYPLVVKPTAQGSALGLTVVDDQAICSAAAMAAFDYGDRILLERFVGGDRALDRARSAPSSSRFPPSRSGRPRGYSTSRRA